jgi:hypothetical protein
MPRAAAIKHIEERRERLLNAPTSPAPASLASPEPDFAAAEPMPVIDRPDNFAADYWRARKLPSADDEPPKPKAKKPRGRRPRGDLTASHDRFRVVDGDKEE